MLVYEDADHGFDDRGLTLSLYLARALSPRNGRVVEQAGVLTETIRGESVTVDASCGERGGTVAYSPEARERAVEDVLGFLSSISVTDSQGGKPTSSLIATDVVIEDPPVVNTPVMESSARPDPITISHVPASFAIRRKGSRVSVEVNAKPLGHELASAVLALVRLGGQPPGTATQTT